MKTFWKVVGSVFQSLFYMMGLLALPNLGWWLFKGDQFSVFSRGLIYGTLYLFSLTIYSRLGITSSNLGTAMSSCNCKCCSADKK